MECEEEVELGCAKMLGSEAAKRNQMLQRAQRRRLIELRLCRDPSSLILAHPSSI